MAQVKDVTAYRAISSGVFKIKGKTRRYIRGQVLSADDPLIRIRPDSFEPLRFSNEVEPSAEVK